MRSIYSENAPKPIGTYAQAVRVGNTLYISGQIPLCPKTMQLIEGDMEKKVAQVFQNLSAICQQENLTLNHIVKLTVYLTNLQDKDAVNAVMTRLYHKDFPARVMLQVSALPMGTAVEIEAIAVDEKL